MGSSGSVRERRPRLGPDCSYCSVRGGIEVGGVFSESFDLGIEAAGGFAEADDKKETSLSLRTVRA
ncbi:hypothetical protein [Haloferax mediterranei]|uniref:hypothetical protein n=1 Tax=Haloferax mediterranei TaxID=2252 RepID=UPI00126721C9|nr:hypothetical protein [Haloferax mediterranei]